VTSPKLVVFGDGEYVELPAGAEGARLLLVSGMPLGEPIARYGPFVMNTAEEIQQALADLRNGTFVR
jgi:redox-sensitive bicupin YhaK (pirin superfamily)